MHRFDTKKSRPPRKSFLFYGKLPLDDRLRIAYYVDSIKLLFMANRNLKLPDILYDQLQTYYMMSGVAAVACGIQNTVS